MEKYKFSYNGLQNYSSVSELTACSWSEVSKCKIIIWFTILVFEILCINLPFNFVHYSLSISSASKVFLQQYFSMACTHFISLPAFMIVIDYIQQLFLLLKQRFIAFH